LNKKLQFSNLDQEVSKMWEQRADTDAYLNSLDYGTVQELMKGNPKLKAYVEQTGFKHNSMPTATPPTPTVTSNLGMPTPPRGGIPHPLAPSARVSAGGQLISPTPTAQSTGAKHYPYGANVAREQFVFQPTDVSTGRVTAYGANLPEHTPSGMIDPTWTAQASAQESAKEAVAKSIAESGNLPPVAEAGAEAGTSLWQGPAPALANMALSAIPTRDKEKVDTPIGDQGSTSGMLKGAGKGALTGATIGSQIAPGVGTAVGAGIGGVAGLLGGGQGYFDTTSPPTITQVGLLRGRGGKLSVPKGMYG